MRRTRLALVTALASAVATLALPAGTSAAAPTAAKASSAGAKADIPVQLLTMNDFHGRISDTTGSDATLTYPDGTTKTVGGAANIATTVQDAKADFAADGGKAASSFFVGAGDLVSASPFNSSVFADEPTVEVLNAMGLDVSSVGNHEFDRGTEELRRISAATDGTYTDDVTACEGVEVGVTGCFTDSTGQQFAGANYDYLAANVVSKKTGQPILPPYQVLDVGGGKKLGLIGVVTDTTPTLVSPTGIADVDFVDEATAINKWTKVLQKKGIQAIGVLIHEGGENTGEDATDPSGCDELTGPIVDINAAVSPAVDLIVSAHSHQAYDCLLPDPSGTPRLVTQAGYYGRLIGDVRLTLDGRTGDVVRYCAPYTAQNVAVTRDDPDPQVASIVSYWQKASAAQGDVVVGSASADITRGGTKGSRRDVESPLGDLIAQAQLEAVDSADYGDPVIAFMNPGGVRADIAKGDVTYSQLFTVQPFGNTVSTLTLTGADIRAVLEQQFESDQARATDLVLGTSEGFAYSYDLSKPFGQRVDPATITLEGSVLDPDGEYRVAVNSFLAAGGDSFLAFTNGTDPTSGPVDVDTAVAYFQEHSPVAPPAADHATATTFATAPAPATGLSGTTTETEEPGTADGVSAVDGPGPGPACDATATLVPNPVKRGAKATFTATRFAPREKVTVTVSGVPGKVTVQADENGSLKAAFTVPKKTPTGSYTATSTGSSGEKATLRFTVTK